MSRSYATAGDGLAFYDVMRGCTTDTAVVGSERSRGDEKQRRPSGQHRYLGATRRKDVESNDERSQSEMRRTG